MMHNIGECFAWMDSSEYLIILIKQDKNSLIVNQLLLHSTSFFESFKLASSFYKEIIIGIVDIKTNWSYNERLITYQQWCLIYSRLYVSISDKFPASTYN